MKVENVEKTSFRLTCIESLVPTDVGALDVGGILAHAAAIANTAGLREQRVRLSVLEVLDLGRLPAEQAQAEH